MATALPRPLSWNHWLSRYWPVAAGFLLLAIPTFLRLGQQTWSTDAGAHAPIVLATGIWLLFQIGSGRLKKDQTEANGLFLGVGLVGALAIYIFGRAYDFISLEAAGLYLVFLATAYRFLGAKSLIANFFPFLYLGFLIPPPGWVIDKITAPLQTFISWVITSGLQAMDFPIVRQGVTLYIAQYQLLVEQACSGMNSIIGLTAISLFYIYIMHRASWKYAAFLGLLIIPVAVLANLIRVLVLVLLTYYYGDAVAQGFLHSTAGILLFAVALMLIFGIDMLVQAVIKRKGAST
ncbi:hypothetical protein MNBD_ALPHA04-830 [hydrothermal vent metagenome]|uniref:Eight transmembrane protein EpsH n=1 Tax=hydrothermal vent metagenome TaxID=652676 RepID=A0A3B0SJC9_9ZZZZ